jgi:hypothetical protein
VWGWGWCPLKEIFVIGGLVVKSIVLGVILLDSFLGCNVNRGCLLGAGRGTRAILVQERVST